MILSNKHTDIVSGGVSRITYLDALRVIAALLVIFNHLPGYTLYQTSFGPKSWLYMIPTMVTRINVPLFFMVTGALLLGKEEPLSRVFSHRVARVLGIIGVFGFLYYVSSPTVHGRGVADFLCKLLSGGIEGSHWFLYSYLGMTMLLPFLRFIARNISRQLFIYLLVLHCLTAAIIPMAVYVVQCVAGVSLSVNLSLPLASSSQIFYPLVGYYIAHNVRSSELHCRSFAILLFTSIAGIIISICFTYHEALMTGTFSEHFVMLFDWVTAASVFIAIKWLFEVGYLKEGAHGLRGIITLLGPLTLGVYVLDPFFRLWWYPAFIALVKPILPTLISSILWCLFSFSIGCLVTAVLKRLPVMKAIL